MDAAINSNHNEKVVKRVLVTGGNGFIGRYLVSRLLEADCHVRILIRSALHTPAHAGVEIAEGDVRDVSAMKKAAIGCDTVFHLAGKAHSLSEIQGNEEDYRSIIVDGTRNVLDAAVAAGVRRFAYFSSVKAMGETASQGLDEDSEPRPTTAYGRCKLAGEHLVLDYGKRTGMHVVALRLPLTYGVGNKGNLLRMIAAIDSGRFPPLPEVGNRRSILHVRNAVHAALLAATLPKGNGEVYIVTDGKNYSTRELYEIICRGLRRPIPNWTVPLNLLKALAVAGDTIGALRKKRFMFDSEALDKLVGSAWYSSQKICSELGYHPSHSFEKSLPELILWYRQAAV